MDREKLTAAVRTIKHADETECLTLHFAVANDQAKEIFDAFAVLYHEVLGDPLDG